MTSDPVRRRRLVLVAALAALAVLVVGVVLLRVGTPPAVDDTARSETGRQPVSTVSGGVAGPGGPAGERAGLPAGFSHDEHGVAAAAVAYAGASQRWLYWTDDQITAALAEMATPDAVDRLTRETLETVRAARDELATSPGRVWWLVHPLAWRVDDYTGDRASVSVWVMRLLSASDVAVPQTEWLTVGLDLEWVAGDWRLADARDTAGPTPMTGPRDEPWQPEPFDEALDGFTRLDGEPVRTPEGR